jgi:ABC-type nitrate/sulfonate/bicarbonate transport system permease component
MHWGIVIFGYNSLTDPATLPLLIVAMGVFGPVNILIFHLLAFFPVSSSIVDDLRTITE